MLHLHKIALLALLSISTWAAHAEQAHHEKPLEIGVVPYISTRVLVATYEPMRAYLEKTLARPVKIYTASGFKQFHLNAQRGDYDVVITSAHLARLLQQENRFTPLLRYSTGGSGLIVTANNSSIKSLQQLRGQVIAVPDQLALASIVCMTYLRDNNLKVGTDFKILEVPSFASAILSVQKGDANAAFAAPAALSQMPQELRESVQPILNTGEFISQIILTHPLMPEANRESIKNLLLQFGNETPEGKRFMTSTGFGTIALASAKDMATLDKYTAESRRLLAE